MCHFRYRSSISHFLIAIAGYITTSIVGYYIYYIAKVNSIIELKGDLKYIEVEKTR